MTLLYFIWCLKNNMHYYLENPSNSSSQQVHINSYPYNQDHSVDMGLNKKQNLFMNDKLKSHEQNDNKGEKACDGDKQKNGKIKASSYSYYDHFFNKFMLKAIQTIIDTIEKIAIIIIKSLKEPNSKSKYKTLFIVATILTISLWIFAEVAAFFSILTTALISIFSIYSLIILIALIFCFFLFRSMLASKIKFYQQKPLQLGQSNKDDIIGSIVGGVIQALISPIILLCFPVMIMTVVLSPLILLFKLAEKFFTSRQAQQNKRNN